MKVEVGFAGCCAPSVFVHVLGAIWGAFRASWVVFEGVDS